MRVACTTLYGGRDFVEELETEKHKNEFPAQNRQIHLDTGTGERREERRPEQCIQHRDEREEEKGRERGEMERSQNKWPGLGRTCHQHPWVG